MLPSGQDIGLKELLAEKSIYQDTTVIKSATAEFYKIDLAVRKLVENIKVREERQAYMVGQ